MAVFLRITAVLTALWAGVWLYLARSEAAPGGGSEPLAVSLGDGLAVANLGFAFLFWRAAANPSGERLAVYTALLTLALRTAKGSYDVLYRLDGTAGALGLIEMVASLALFVGILNALPATLAPRRTPPSGPSGS
jgi:hypothetical protein